MIPLEEKRERSVVRDLLLGFFYQFRDEIVLVVVGTVVAIVRAAGVTIESGQTGLLFSFGRVKRELRPGFHFLIPFLQSARKVPTRSRTLDLPAQRVVTMQGLVYHVDANLIYRVTGVRLALVEIDDLEKGMRQMLGLGVQEVVRACEREELADPRHLDDELGATLSRRLAPWGVSVERAGMTSITPSRQTLRITQIGRVAGERASMLRHLRPSVGARRSLCLIGTRALPRRRALHLRQFERNARRRRRLRKTLMHRGWMAVQIKQAGQRLQARSKTGGTLQGRGRGGARTDPRRGKPRLRDEGKVEGRRGARRPREAQR